MDWSLTRPEQGNIIGESDDFIEEQVKRNVAFAKLEDLIAWGRAHSLWPFNFGLSCSSIKSSLSPMILPCSGRVKLQSITPPQPIFAPLQVQREFYFPTQEPQIAIRKQAPNRGLQ